MPKKLVIAAVAVLLAGGVAFKLTRPQKAAPKPKIAGVVYVLPKEFLVNLRDGRYAKLSVGLVLEHLAPADPAAGETPPEGYGPLPQEALIRAAVTDELSDQPAARLISAPKRERLRERIKRRLERTTDVHPTGIIFTDLTVQ